MSAVVSAPPPRPLQTLLPGLLLLAALLLLFRDTATAMVGIWTRSETFAHAFLVPPITLWLVWRRRVDLALLQPQPAPWVLLPIAAVALLWLLGELAGVNAATQLALVALIVLAVPAVFGLAVARCITFPLMFLFFSVPIGDFMVPQMMEWTADFTVAAVAFSGVPVYREGLQFVIPSGNWSVVEACSGVRYLIASFMVGSLFAYLNYRSTKRRVIFIALSLVAPIVANWLRAYMIVMLGHISGNKLAVGADHLVYGWVFFGIIITVMFVIGARWSEPDAPVASAGPAATAGDLAAASARSWPVVVAITALLLATQAVVWQLNRPAVGPAPQLVLPATLPGGWAAAAEGSQLADWRPAYQQPSATAPRVYQRAAPGGNERVAVWVGYYRNQSSERKLVTSTNVLVEQTDTEWSTTASGSRALPPGSPAAAVRTAALRQPAQPSVQARTQLDVAYLYWIGGRYTTSDARAKVDLALQRLAGRGDAAAVLIFSTLQQPAGRSAEQLQGFVAQQLAPLSASLQATAEATKPSR
ncbi:MAG: exosortase A [Rubrivivax sp.]|nr:exosortase A [Rubrivivax sp.]